MSIRRKGIAKTTYIAIIIAIIVIAAIGGAAYMYMKPAPPAKESIKIGISLGLSGGFAAPSQRQLWGAMMWIEEVNERGGIYVAEYGKKLKVSLVYYDDRSDSATATRLYERLITEDKVDILLGPYGSGITLATAPIAEKYKVIMISQMAAADTIPAKGYDYVFTLLTVASRFGLSRVELLDSLSPKPKSIALLTSNELYPLTVARASKALWEKAGYTTVFYEEYPRGVTDFSAILLRAKAANPDVFYAVCYPADAFVIMRQMKDIKFAPKLVFLDDGPNDPKFVEVFGKEAEGVFTQMSWHWELPFPGAKEFVEKFKARYNELPRHWSAFPYAAGQVIEKAIEKAGSLNSEKLRAALLELKNVQTIVGPVSFGDWTNPMGEKLKQINLEGINYCLQIQKGEMKVAIPRKYASVDIIYPWPGWAS
jgi:branched-chain amino acid transport system substrate-binding protein